MTATISNRKETSFGNKRIVEFDVALGAYTGGGTGVSVTPASLGMSIVDIVIIEPGTDGYIYEYDYTDSSIKAYMTGGLSFSATVSAPSVTVTGASCAVLGGAATGTVVQLSAATSSGKLSKTTATSRVIPLATFFGSAAPTASLATAPTFSATTAQGTLSEVSSATLSTAVHCLAIGN